MSLTKKLLKATKEKGCEVIKDWMKGIRRHMYWCATSTVPGFGDLIKAKWNSFMRHVADKHTEHPDPLFKSCKHDSLQPRKWIKIGDY
jgi:solute carrier family 8 (sodium/calcium exchanger)